MSSLVFSPHRLVSRGLVAILMVSAAGSLSGIVTGVQQALAHGFSASGFFLPLLLAPVQFVLIWALIHLGKIRIEVSPERIRLSSANGPVHMYWGEIQHFHFDSLPFTRSSKSGIEIFEVADGLRPIRFFEVAECGDTSCTEDGALLPKHALRIGSAGVPLTRLQCRALIDAIRRYAGLVPVRREGLF